MTAKEQAHRMLDELPESATWDDVLYAVYIRQKIARGIEDIENGRIVADEDVRREFLK
jgi:predicted transcriptional regulator